MNTQISEGPFCWAQVMCRYHGKSFALIIPSRSYEISIFTSVPIQKCMLRERKKFAWDHAARWVRIEIFNPNWPGSRAHDLELIDKETYFLRFERR